MKSEFLIKEIMDKKRLTIQDLSETVNIDKEKLTDFLNGENKLSLEEYVKIGAYFNLSLDTLVTGIPTKQDERKIRKSEIFRLQIVGVLKKLSKYISIRSIGTLIFFALLNFIIGTIYLNRLFDIAQVMEDLYGTDVAMDLYSIMRPTVNMVLYINYSTILFLIFITIDIILYFVFYKHNNITDKSIENKLKSKY